MPKATTRRVPTVRAGRLTERTGDVRYPLPSPTPRTIPLDDEPLTPADRRAIEEGRRAFARGDYRTLDEVKAALAANVARQRLRPRRKGARPRS